MIVTRKRFLENIFITRRLSKSLRRILRVCERQFSGPDSYKNPRLFTLILFGYHPCKYRLTIDINIPLGIHREID